MTPSLHDVTIKVGRSVYNIKTTLDDASLARVVGMMSEISAGFEHAPDQERTLLLLCLQLGWALEKVRSRLESVSEEFEEK